jgi:type III secretion system YscI/HrpB-like protein
MVDIGSLATSVVQSTMTAPATVKSEAPAEAVARLEELQNAVPQQPTTPAQDASQSVTPAEPNEPSQLDIAPASGESPGDSILRNIDRMSKGFDGTVDQISQAINSVKPGETMSAADLLKLQFQLTQVTVQQEITGKVTGKATQSLETFLKNQ